MPPVPPPSGTSPQRGPRHRGQLTEVSLSTATDESPKGLQGGGRHSAQSDQTQQHTQTTRQHTHTPSPPENARKTRTRCISIMARTRCISIMTRLMTWSNAFITFERPSPPPTPWRRNRAQRCAGTRGHDEPSQLNPAMLVPGRSTRTPPCSPIAGHNVRRGQRRRSRGQRRQPRRRPRGQRRRPSTAASTAAWAASTAAAGAGARGATAHRTSVDGRVGSVDGRRGQQAGKHGSGEVRRPAANRRTAQQPSTRLLQLGQPLLPSRSQRMRVHGASRSMRVHGASRGATRSLAASSASRSSRPRSQASSAPLNKAGAEAEAKRTAVTYNNNSNNNNDDDKIEISVAYGNYWHSDNNKNNSNANG